MIIFLLLNVLIANFQQKWYVDRGTHKGYGRIVIGDTDHDARPELIFGSLDASLQKRVRIYELIEGDTFALQLVVDTSTIDVWAVEDFDNDGKHDLLLSGMFGSFNKGPQIFEAPDSFSHPAVEVWRDTIGPFQVLPICVFDIDQDGFPEFVKNKATPYGDLGIYESVGDNQYELIFVDDPDTLHNEAPAATIAFGDFDGDSSIEFVLAGGNEWYWVYECIGDNNYEKIAEGQLPTANIRDCFYVPDADSDGKPEFVVKGCTYPDGQFQVFIFEATSNNTYEIIDTLNFFGFSNGYYGGYSAAGDIDGDGKPEIALEGCYRVYIIEAEGDNNFYVFDTLPGRNGGSTIAVYDFDNNSYEEVIISGDNYTFIYEYDPGGIEEYRSPINMRNNHNATIINGPLLLPEGKTCKVFDITGRVVMPDKIKPGIYFIEVEGKIKRKVVKVR